MTQSTKPKRHDCQYTLDYGIVIQIEEPWNVWFYDNGRYARFQTHYCPHCGVKLE